MRRTLEISALALALVAGCDAASEGRCTSDAQCRIGLQCIDERCVAASDVGARDGGRDGAVDGDGGGDAGTDGALDASCGGAGIGVTGTPPAVLIVFDRSCSMRRNVSDPTAFASGGPEDPTSRWYVAREAVRGMIARYPTRVNWGLLPFPGVLQGCGDVPPVTVAPAPGAGTAVMASLESSEVQPYTYCGDTIGPEGPQPHQTPTGDALAAARAEPALADTSRERFIILITDGGASCGETETTLGAQAASIRDEVAPVIVIGFSAEAETASAGPTLEAIAANGGLPRPGAPPSYYHADTGAELAALLDTLVAATLPCTFALSEAPPDPSMLHVAANGTPLAEDATNGWTYDAATQSLVLHGAACDAVRAGTTTRIDAAYGCPVPSCTPVSEACDGLDNDCDGVVDDDCLI